jgi:hypothetical protein
VTYLVANADWLGLLKRKRRRLSFELLQGLTNAAGP